MMARQLQLLWMVMDCECSVSVKNVPRKKWWLSGDRIMECSLMREGKEGWPPWSKPTDGQPKHNRSRWLGVMDLFLLGVFCLFF